MIGLLAEKTLLRTRLLAVILLVAVAIAYLPALQNGFVSDDLYLISQRAELFQSPGSLGKLLSNPYWWGTDRQETREYIYRPWVTFTYWLENRIGGNSPAIYHVSNYLVHLANTGLLAGLMTSICGSPVGIVVAALAALSPAGLTSVGWIAGRTDLWATFFTLLFLRFFRKGQRDGRAFHYAVAATSWFLAICAKEIALIAPALALLLDFVSPVRAGQTKTRPKGVVFAYGALALPLAANFLLRRLTVGTAQMGSFDPNRILGQAIIWPEQYLRSATNILFPFRYSFFSDLEWSQSGSELWLVLGWLLFAGIVALIAWGLRRRSLWAAGGAWFGIVLFPVYILGQSWAVQADFYSYLALPGFWLFMVDGIKSLADRTPFLPTSLFRFWRIPAFLILAVFAMLIFVRLPILNAERSLWQHMVARLPNSAKPSVWLAQTYFDEGDSLRGLEYLNAAVKADTNDWIPHYRLAKWYLDRDDARNAAPYVEALTTLAPMEPDGLVLVAYYAYLIGRCDIAAATYEQAFSLLTPTPEQQFDYGLSLMCLNRIPDALKVYQLVTAERPTWAYARANLASCYDLLGQLESAAAEFHEALRLDSSLAGAWASLALVQARQGQVSEAKASAARFAALNPDGHTAEQQRSELLAAGLLRN